MRRFKVMMAIAAVVAFPASVFADSTAEFIPVAASRASPSASEFAAQATQYTLTEIQLGKLAGQKGSKVGITALGTRLARDHGRLGTMLQSICRDKGLTLPVGLDEQAGCCERRLSAGGIREPCASSPSRAQATRRGVRENHVGLSAGGEPGVSASFHSTNLSCGHKLRQRRIFVA
jgi:hypothetical protein